MIVIAGDSWGCGEWGEHPEKGYSLLHQGIEHYLKNLGLNVVNLSLPGGSNSFATYRLSNFNLTVNDKIIWFQTDPIRDLRPYNTNFTNIIKNYDSFIKEQNSLLDSTYKKLNDLNISICCIGGCSKLNLVLLQKYNNLIPLIPSAIQFFYPDYNHPDIWTSEWINYITANCTLDFIEPQKLKQDLLYENEYSEFFYPDGKHMNRKAHKVLTDYIIRNYL